MKHRLILTAIAVAAVWAIAAEAQAQLFGNRSMRGSLSRRTSPGSTGVGDVVTGSERYVRGNRRETNFVGADSRDTSAFVGSQVGSTTGRIQSAVSSLRVESVPDANRIQPPASRSRTGMYRPRLSVDFGFPPLSSQEVSANLTRQLETSLTRHLRSAFSIDQIRSIEVSLEGKKATLRGEVSSERERNLAALLALFEPGISQVQNELLVRPPLAAGEIPPKDQAVQPAPQPDRGK